MITRSKVMAAVTEPIFMPDLIQKVLEAYPNEDLNEVKAVILGLLAGRDLTLNNDRKIEVTSQ